MCPRGCVGTWESCWGQTPAGESPLSSHLPQHHPPLPTPPGTAAVRQGCPRPGCCRGARRLRTVPRMERGCAGDAVLAGGLCWHAGAGQGWWWAQDAQGYRMLRITGCSQGQDAHRCGVLTCRGVTCTGCSQVQPPPPAPTSGATGQPAAATTLAVGTEAPMGSSSVPGMGGDPRAALL